MFCLQLSAQDVFTGSITYKCKVKYDNKEDSLQILDYPPNFLDILMGSVKEIYHLKKDSTLVQRFYGDKGSFNDMILSTRKKVTNIDVVAGRSIRWNKSVSGKYRKLSSYKRLPEEDQVILGKKCQAWKSETKHNWRKVWLTSEVSENWPKVKDVRMVVDDQLILKEVFYVKNSKTYEWEAVSIDNIAVNNISGFIKKHTEADVKSKYKPIAKNSHLKETKLAIGVIAPDIYYREVFGDGMKHLYETTQKSKFTMIEFWGTWCGPCLAATPKIKKLREKFKESELSILSMNTSDRIEAKIKKIIKDKGMNWEHGYSTDKFVKIFNDNRSFPRAILLDHNNKVLFIGNPNVDIEKIEAIVDGKEVVTK